MADIQEMDLLDLSGLTYYDTLIKEYIKTADVGTVNGHSVAKDVPSDAVFTDTTYSAVTDENAGLMTPTQKARLEEVTKVGVTPDITTGTKIATVTIDNTPTDIYAPEQIAPNNGKLTVQLNGTSKGEFTANQSTDTTVNIEAATGVTVGTTAYTVTNGVITIPAYPTTLPASDVKEWAKADNKPIYTANEVGALPNTTVIPTITDDYSATSSDGMSGKAVSSAIASAISGVTQFDYEIVTSLPETGVKGKIYLLANSQTETQNIYDEYLWINNAWEKIGTTKIDLSNYYTKTEVDTELGKKVDVVVGKGLSTNDFTTDEKTKLNGIAEGATAVSESTVSGWGFTKNAGTVTGITMNGGAKVVTEDGTVNLGTVITAHQDISGKADVATTLAGYGIGDAKIVNGTITLGTDSITPLTSSSKINYDQLTFATEAQIAKLFE